MNTIEAKEGEAMSTDDFVYYLLLKQEWDSFTKNLNERIKNKQDVINDKLAQMNRLAEEIRAELGNV
jgi:F0F1-type ATP synthase membrane subunit b/b'